MGRTEGASYFVAIVPPPLAELRLDLVHYVLDILLRNPPLGARLPLGLLHALGLLRGVE
jgi:hypothetical protein